VAGDLGEMAERIRGRPLARRYAAFVVRRHRKPDGAASPPSSNGMVSNPDSRRKHSRTSGSGRERWLGGEIDETRRSRKGTSRVAAGPLRTSDCRTPAQWSEVEDHRFERSTARRRCPVGPPRARRGLRLHMSDRTRWDVTVPEWSRTARTSVINPVQREISVVGSSELHAP